MEGRMKTVFTTGEAAKICKVSQQTIIRCFDNGQLKGFRVPGSRFRRIPREALYKFMKDNGIPTDALESGKRKVLLVDDDNDLVELMTKVLEEDGRFEVRVASNGFDAGMMVKEYRPDIIVLDVMLPDINGKEVCHRVRADSTLEDVRILCISGMIEEDKVQELRLSGADDFLNKPFEIEALIDRMCGLLEIEPAATIGCGQGRGRPMLAPPAGRSCRTAADAAFSWKEPSP
jgi:excisionase family DNA binding protein